MSSRQEKLLRESRRFSKILATKSRGYVRSTWLFGSLAAGKIHPEDADIGVEIAPSGAAQSHVVDLIQQIAPHGRFHGIRIDAIIVTPSELICGNDFVSRGIRTHNIRLWPS